MGKPGTEGDQGKRGEKVSHYYLLIPIGSANLMS